MVVGDLMVYLRNEIGFHVSHRNSQFRRRATTTTGDRNVVLAVKTGHEHCWLLLMMGLKMDQLMSFERMAGEASIYRGKARRGSLLTPLVILCTHCYRFIIGTVADDNSSFLRIAFCNGRINYLLLLCTQGGRVSGRTTVGPS